MKVVMIDPETLKKLDDMSSFISDSMNASVEEERLRDIAILGKYLITVGAGMVAQYGSVEESLDCLSFSATCVEAIMDSEEEIKH